MKNLKILTTFGYWLKKKRKGLRETKEFIGTTIKGWQYTYLVQRRIKKEESSLYATPSQLNVQTFFQIMETSDLSLLRRPRKKPLKLKQINLNDVWYDLLDYYYSNTNKKSWEDFVGYINDRLSVSNEILLAEASINLIALGDEEGIKVLKSIDMPTSSIKAMKAAINRKKTAIELMDAKRHKSDKGEAVKFESLLASIELQLGYQLRPDELTLARWVGLINTLRIKHEAEKEALKKNKK